MRSVAAEAARITARNAILFASQKCEKRLSILAAARSISDDVQAIARICPYSAWHEEAVAPARVCNAARRVRKLVAQYDLPRYFEFVCFLHAAPPWLPEANTKIGLTLQVKAALYGRHDMLAEHLASNEYASGFPLASLRILASAMSCPLAMVRIEAVEHAIEPSDPYVLLQRAAAMTRAQRCASTPTSCRQFVFMLAEHAHSSSERRIARRAIRSIRCDAQCTNIEHAFYGPLCRAVARKSPEDALEGAVACDEWRVAVSLANTQRRREHAAYQSSRDGRLRTLVAFARVMRPSDLLKTASDLFRLLPSEPLPDTMRDVENVALFLAACSGARGSPFSASRIRQQPWAHCMLAHAIIAALSSPPNPAYCIYPVEVSD